MYYRMLLIGSGPLYQMDLDGQNAEKIDGKDITRSLYSDEKELYYTMKYQGEFYPVLENEE